MVGPCPASTRRGIAGRSMNSLHGLTVDTRAPVLVAEGLPAEMGRPPAGGEAYTSGTFRGGMARLGAPRDGGSDLANSAPRSRVCLERRDPAEVPHRYRAGWWRRSRGNPGQERSGGEPLTTAIICRSMPGLFLVRVRGRGSYVGVPFLSSPLFIPHPASNARRPAPRVADQRGRRSRPDLPPVRSGRVRRAVRVSGPSRSSWREWRSSWQKPRRPAPLFPRDPAYPAGAEWRR
jgi:hypothetical protein